LATTHFRPRASRYRLPPLVPHPSRHLMAVVAALVAIGGLGLPAGMALLGGVPSAQAVSDASLPQDTLLYDRSGQVVLGDLHPPGYQRYHTSLDRMGTWLPRATVDAEEANFWQEGGISPVGILRAALTDLSQQRLAQGGSTITQQLVKLRVTGGADSLSRKLREAIIAIQVSGTYSKSQILEMYLNTIFYGNNSYGAQAAAQNYFHVDASNLNLAQAAFLAGIPRSPSAYNPFDHFEAAKQRQQQVLEAMVRNHTISQAQANQAFSQDLRPPEHMVHSSTLNLAPGFVSWVQQDLEQHWGQSTTLSGGLRVTTTLNWSLQQLAQQSVTDTVNANSWRNLSDGALTAIDPRTGQVVAMVGSAGPNTAGGQINMAVWPPRNPGSTFKLFTYTAAIASRKYTMVTPIADLGLSVSLQGGQSYRPGNDDGRFHGICQLQQCLGNSLNVPAVQVEMTTGVPTVVEQARAMGAPPYVSHGSTYTDQVSANTFQPALTLGGYPATVLSMASGAAVLADQGVSYQPTGLLAVRDSAGKLLSQVNQGRQALDAGVAFIMSQILSNDANREMIFGSNSPLVLPDRHVAAKTGTTDEFTDGWTVGYTPSLASAVWMGNADSTPMARNTDGVTVAAPAWHQFMAGALDLLGKGDEWYDPPGNIHEESVRGHPAWFLNGTSARTPPPRLPSSVHLSGDPKGSSVVNWRQLCKAVPMLCSVLPGGRQQDQTGGD
jgi:penicillin-binding protein 1A